MKLFVFKSIIEVLFTSHCFTNDFPLMNIIVLQEKYLKSFKLIFRSYIFPTITLIFFHSIPVLKCLRLSADPVTLELKRGK